MSYSRLIRSVGNVANLSTPLGLVLGVVGRGRFRKHDHLIVADNVHLPLLDAGAITIGSVVLILGRSLEELEQEIPTALAHEEEHSWQWAYCLGLPFIPLYLAAMAWSGLRCGDRSSANYFEVQANLKDGGYTQQPTRPLKEGLAALLAPLRHRSKR